MCQQEIKPDLRDMHKALLIFTVSNEIYLIVTNLHMLLLLKYLYPKNFKFQTVLKSFMKSSH